MRKEQHFNIYGVTTRRFNLSHINQKHFGNDSILLDEISSIDIKEIIQRYDYTVISLWNPGCPSSDIRNLNFMKNLIDTLTIISKGYEKIAFVLVSYVKDLPQVKKSFRKFGYQQQAFYLISETEGEILTYKVRDFWKNMVPELYPMFKDDLSNLTFAIFDMKGQIIYARNSQTYDIRVVHKYNELDSILKVVK